LHDALKATGYVGHDLERLLVRLIFCLFADDTGIFDPRDIFLTLIKDRTREDGSDIGPWLSHLFDILNTPEDRRQQNLDEDLKKFPYVNGDLFRERLPTAAFDAPMRALLLEACEFNWSAVSPAIFGALFQSVMTPRERRAQGAHYTTERNILKVIEPLFLDDLRAEFNRLRARRDTLRLRALDEFRTKLGSLRFFDPACGCGNFLIITYRELRLLELELLKEMFRTRHDEQARFDFDVATLSRIDVDQFCGIELGEFPALIAEVAMWMMDHIMNNLLSIEFGESYVRIPLRKSPRIQHGDALEVDWATVLPPDQCSYLLGNPPFVGAKYQSDIQRAQVRRLANLGGSGGTLDYVAAWFLKAGAYIHEGAASIGFVATNSITQGEQVAQLWPILFDRYSLELSYAHRTFAWGSDARGVAHVHVVIIGLTRRDREVPVKRLFSYDNINGDPTESHHRGLTAYLFGADAIADRHLVVHETTRPLCNVPRCISGTQPIDNGQYIFDVEERAAFLAEEPAAAQYLRPYVGSEEYINGLERWILSLQGVAPGVVRTMPRVVERLRNVREFRRASKRKSTLAIADTPERYNVEVIPDRPFLVIPKVSSERREYVPIGWLQPPTIPSDLVFVVSDGDLWSFGVLTSRMHMAWLRHIGGRLKSDYRYSIGLVYNTFPMPTASDAQKARVRELAQTVLDVRTGHPGNTLADLYDPDVMPRDLRRAHQALDGAVDRLYRSANFPSDRDRVEHLFAHYERLVTPLIAAPPRARKRRTARHVTQ
ncbi:MAG: class I SAM-dependent DNA methyltransferase, partial [Rhodospirillaceae bacterium]|nr:class I SAM-dependent DNA methyltransferase [Rhodospirillaceae bacterium]